MTFDEDRTFGATRVECDVDDCRSEEEIDGFDGHPLPWGDVSRKIRDMGWSVKKVKGEWVHECPNHGMDFNGEELPKL